jgi:hypothetical protein
MDHHRPPWTLGAAVLGLILCLFCAATSSRTPASQFQAPLDFPQAGGFDSPRTAQRFGWPISSTESDPRVWAQLRGVGPVLARRLARLGAQGTLLTPRDLLQVRGIGIKMASRLEAWVLWPPAAQTDVEAPPRTSRKGTE